MSQWFSKLGTGCVSAEVQITVWHRFDPWPGNLHRLWVSLRERDEAQLVPAVELADERVGLHCILFSTV